MKELTDYLFHSDLKSAEILLNSGVDINTKYSSGVYPIDAAINSDNPETLKFIIERGADINIEFGLPLIIALDNCIQGMVQDDRDYPYSEALEMVSILLTKGASLCIKDDNGNRPIDILKAYASTIEDLKKLKEIFRPIINNIDGLLS